MEISFETAQLVHEAIAYTITKTSYFTTGQIPSADDINDATRLFFCKFLENEKNITTIR